VGAPLLRGAPDGVVVASAFGGETWYSHGGEVLRVGDPNVWPAGDGFVSWHEGTTGATAVLGRREVGVLEFASNPTFVLALGSTISVDPESPGAQPMPMIPEPGRLLTPPTSAPVVAPTTVAPSTTTTPPSTAAPTTERDSGGDLGKSTVFGALIVAGVALVLIATAIMLRRRHPAPEEPPL
jgi:hypothetical protein